MITAMLSLVLATTAPLARAAPISEAAPLRLSASVPDAAPPSAAPAELMLRINLPERRLDVIEGNETIRSYPATIGSPSHSTPTGRYRVSTITWNPWWHPPDSRWARDAEDTPPGPTNPMGRVKLRFDRLLYVHGTHNEASLGEAVSHGCIRLANEDALELAGLIAERTGVLSSAEVRALEASPDRTREVELPGEGILLVIEYRVVKEGEGGVQRFEDVYDLGLLPHEKWMLEHAGQALRQPGGGA